jgi:CheY-like chemotaxis protein
MQKRSVSLSAIVNNVEAMLRRLIPANLALTFNHQTELPLVYADVCNIEQVIINLVVNARDAMPAGGTLTVRTGITRISGNQASQHAEARPGDFVTLTVTDTGEGMSEDTLSHIFEPFFTTKEVGKGTGMGLSTVFGIVHQHEGWIEVHSTPGNGTTFQAYFPTTEHAEEIKILPLPPVSRKGIKDVILLVEDDDNVRALARSVLHAAGYRVLEAADGPKAVDIWRAFDGCIDMLLTDMVMPGGLTGRDVAERFSADWPEGKILYSSGYSVDLFGGDLSLREGFNYLPKPYFANQLVDAVARTRARPPGTVPAREEMAVCLS